MVFNLVSSQKYFLLSSESQYYYMSYFILTKRIIIEKGATEYGKNWKKIVYIFVKNVQGKNYLLLF